MSPVAIARIASGRAARRPAPAVLDALDQRGADFAHQRQIFGQRLVGTLQHDHALLAAQHLAEQVAREGTEHGQIDHADLELARLAQVVGDASACTIMLPMPTMT